jgi:hypothetical protein
MILGSSHYKNSLAWYHYIITVAMSYFWITKEKQDPSLRILNYTCTRQSLLYIVQLTTYNNHSRQEDSALLKQQGRPRDPNSSRTSHSASPAFVRFLPSAHPRSARTTLSLTIPPGYSHTHLPWDFPLSSATSRMDVWLVAAWVDVVLHDILGALDNLNHLRINSSNLDILQTKLLLPLTLTHISWSNNAAIIRLRFKATNVIRHQHSFS